MASDDHDFGYPTGAHGRIPSFSNVEEEAEFWDTHDFTDYLEEAKSVTVVYGGLAERLTIRLEPSDRETLAQLSRSKGIGPSTLVRMWVKERLQQEEPADCDHRELPRS
jgi:hypothetical protein